MIKTTIGLGAAALGIAALSMNIAATPAAATTAAAAAEFELDGTHSTLVFRIGYAGLTSFYGRFNEYSGTFHINESDLSKTAFDLKVDAESVDTGNERRDNHLRSPDFFSAKQHGEIRFVSKKVTVKDGKKLEVSGDLTFRGVTKEVTASVTYGGQKEGGRGGIRAGFDGELTIKRQDFGVTYGEGMLGDEVTILMGLTGLKKS